MGFDFGIDGVEWGIEGFGGECAGGGGKDLEALAGEELEDGADDPGPAVEVEVGAGGVGDDDGIVEDLVRFVK